MPKFAKASITPCPECGSKNTYKRRGLKCKDCGFNNVKLKPTLKSRRKWSDEFSSRRNAEKIKSNKKGVQRMKSEKTTTKGRPKKKTADILINEIENMEELLAYINSRLELLAKGGIPKTQFRKEEMIIKYLQLTRDVLRDQEKEGLDKQHTINLINYDSSIDDLISEIEQEELTAPGTTG